MTFFGITFNIIDFIAIGVVLIWFFQGRRRGLFFESFCFLGIAIILVAALRYYIPLSKLLIAKPLISNHPEVAQASAFWMIVIAASVCILIIRLLVYLFVKPFPEQQVCSTGGALLGIAHGIVLVLLFIFGLGICPQPYLHQLFIQDSFIGHRVFKTMPYVVERLNELPDFGSKMSGKKQ